ncbi:MAG TPA: Calx-beta domain-containing protein, partial [Pyrinomonadaceae bacterium]|nr:Calx-beta domain-containing protein [Pyrinomonadaceae bacterium]
MNRHRLLVLFVLATVVVCLIGLRHAHMQSSTLRRITSTSEEGINLNPSISGDGRIIGFESTEDVAAAGGADHFRAIRANISGDPASFFQVTGSRFVAPAVSQDGSRIAFASRDDLVGTNSDGNSEIFLFDGAKLIQVTNTSPGGLANRITNGNFQPSISDDGRFIAFSSNRDLAGQNGDGNLEIVVYDSATNSFAQLTNSSGVVGATDAKLSGDGTTVAFIRDNGASPGTARDLMKQPRSGGSATTLASNVQSLAMTYGRAISDDGARVVYSAETATNTTQVFIFDGRSGGTIRQITSLGARVTEVPLDPTISGDGSRIAFAARRAVSGAAGNSDGGVELYVYDFPTLTFSKITNAPSSATAEVVSSLNDDGSIVAFNFPRVLSGAVTNSGTENNSEIYALAPPARPPNGPLTAILNDASLGHEPSATKAVAPNSIAVAQGTNLASTTVQSQRLADGTFPTNVAGTRVTVNGRAAQIFFVSPAQINFLVPPQTEIGSAEVIVTNSENFPSRGNVSTLRAAPGIFTKTGDGIGEGVILNADTLQDGPFDPTGGNLHLSIFTTGARNAAATTVSIGGRVVNAEAVLPSNTMPGLDEVHVRVPADLRGAGTVNLTANSDGRDSNPVTVSFIGDPGRAILFNEVLADPPNGIAGDANNDGVRDTTDDEFVELVNGSSAETIGMSGWTVKTRANGSTTETTRFTFPAGISLAPGTAAVIFGGGTFSPTDPIFGCAQIFRATSASSGLSLTNTGLTILLRDSAGNLIAQFSYGGSTGLDGNNSQSLTRSPDITGAFVLHTTANPARRFSPGLKVDGTPFGTCAGHPATVTISPTSTSVNLGQSTQFTAQTLDQFGRAMTGVPITFTSDNTTVATIDSTSTNPANGVVTANVSTHNPGVAHITASTTDGTAIANSTPATLTVVGPALSVNDVNKNEGNAGANTFTFTVSLSLPAPSGGVKFDIATQDGSATAANNDYVARALTNQVIPAGAQTYSFDVTVNGDTAIEPNENFFVSIANVSGASITKGQGTGTIVNDDSPTLSVSDVSANEGDSGPTTFTFTVTTPVVAEAGGITFDIATADGTANAASGDYVARASTGQTIPAGQSSYTFAVTVNGDTLVEANETFFVNITNVSGATVNDSQGQGTIQNDDTPNLVISQIYPGGGLTNASYTNDFIELYNRGTSTIDFSITQYSAQFLSTTGSTWVKTDLNTGVIAPGRYFLIREASGGATGVSLPSPDATGTINLTSTTDGKVALVSGTTLLAGSCPGDDGTAPFNPTNVADFAGYGGTAATANHCYEGTGPAAFTLGNNASADFRKAGGCVDTNDNAGDFFTAQANPRNSAAPISDCKPEITINDVTVTEGNSGTVNATFTVSLSTTSAQTIKVDFATADGTATAPADYQANSGTLTFNPGDLTKTITVLVNGDTMDEPNETFFVNLSNAANAVILNSQGQGTINDNDAAPSVSINDVTVTEGDSGTTAATFTVTLSAASGFTVTANYATADGSANASSDYQAASGTVTFNP